MKKFAIKKWEKRNTLLFFLIALPFLSLLGGFRSYMGNTESDKQANEVAEAAEVKATPFHQKLGISDPAEWDFIISTEEFAKTNQHNYAVILALKFGTVIYKDIDGTIVTSNQDIMITPNKVVRPWSYKLAGKEVTHKHPKREKSKQGTGLLGENVEVLERESRGSQLFAIIVSIGMDDELGLADGVEAEYQSKLQEKNLKEFHVLNSREVPEKYLELLDKYQDGVGVLLHITC